MGAHDRIRLIGQSQPKSRTPANAGVLDLFNVAGATGTGELLLHFGLVLELVGDEFAVINLGESREARFVLLFSYRLVVSHEVHMVRAREEGEPTNNLPVLLNPAHNANPFVLAY